VPQSVWRQDPSTPKRRKASAFFVALRQDCEHPAQWEPGVICGRTETAIHAADHDKSRFVSL
jgi:hypothetical protein